MDTLQEQSILVSLSISKWTARKHDKKITDEVKQQHNASDDAGRYNKMLAAKSDLEEIQKIEGEARNFHYDNTLPWGENERLLSAANYFNYLTEMGKLKSKFEIAKNDFIQKYPSIILEARIRLNGMFNEKDYPKAESIGDKFDFNFKFFPTPDTDFRVKLKDDEVQRLKAHFETEVTNRLAEAVKDIWTRIKDQLIAMRDRLSQKDAIFRDSLFDNLKELVGLIPKLNVTGDADIQAACDEMVKLIADPDAVRKNSNLRNQKAEEVQDVLNKFNTFFK